MGLAQLGMVNQSKEDSCKFQVQLGEPKLILAQFDINGSNLVQLGQVDPWIILGSNNYQPCSINQENFNGLINLI